MTSEARAHKGDPLRGPRDVDSAADASPSTGETNGVGANGRTPSRNARVKKALKLA